MDDRASAAAAVQAAVTTVDPPAPEAAAPAPRVQVDWPRRIATGVAIAAVGFATVVWPLAYAVLILAIAIGSLWEFAQLSGRKGPAVEFPVALAAVVAYIALAHFGIIRRYESVLLGATVVIALATATFTAKENRLAASGYTLLGVLYIGKLLSYFVTIRAMPEIGMPLTFAAIFLIAMTDISAMVVGLSFGRTPLTSISPRKTVEGAVGGLLVPTAIGACLGLVPGLHFTWWEGAAIGAITSFAAQAGDLVESGLKRDARVKDAGSALQSHGGLLDRFDSFMFGGIGFYFSLWLVGFAVPGLHALMRETQVR